MSQTYLSMVERGGRRVPVRLARRLVRNEPQLATGLSLDSASVKAEDLPRLLGGLGYPGFSYLADPNVVANPAAILLAGLQHVPARVTEALPWVLVTFADLDWDWLLDQAKRSSLQNRLGYLVSLASELAQARIDRAVATRLRTVESRLEEARLAKEDTLGRTVTEVERRHLRAHRPAAAAHWNLLTSLRAQDLRYAL